MKATKNTLKICSILTGFVIIFQVFSLISVIFLQNLPWFDILTSGVNLGITVITLITYLFMMRKDNEYLASHRWAFVTVMVLNIFNNLIMWIISFFVYLTISRLARLKFFSNVEYRYDNNDPNRNTIIIEPSDYEVTSKVDILASEIKKLDELKRKKIITEEEYNKLKTELLDKFI